MELKARLFRDYPMGSFGSHIIGYIGRINDRDLERIEENEDSANYRGTDHIGKAGLEKSYERELHGLTGFEEVEVDSGGRAVRALRRTPATPGNNLVLTIDLKLQEVVEKAFGNRRGALVAIEPGSGGVLALVSLPTFDPNLFVDGIAPQDWDELNTSPDHPMVNRALNGAYPPGSTFKPFMALAALMSGKRTPGQAISDPGFFDFGGHHFRDDKAGGHGTVDMYKSIVQSCDTYYYRLANDMGIDLIASTMGMFGFGSRTGIDIEGESSGVLPSPEWKKRRFKKPEQQKWFGGETISIGIGQGYNAYTMLQLAHATATVAAGGVMFKPHLVKYIESAKDGSRRMIEPQPVKTIAIKSEHLETIRRGMIGVNREGRYRSPRLCGRSLRLGRQDRYGSGVLPEGRKIFGKDRRAPARPRALHCLCAGRQAHHRAGRARRKRRLWRPVGRADRPPGAGLLSSRQVAGRCRAGRPGSRRPGGGGRW